MWRWSKTRRPWKKPREIILAWRPDDCSPPWRPGTVVEDRSLPPRASWKLIEDAMAGRVSEHWADARTVRLDGPRCNDTSFQALVDSGCLDRIETLHLASDGFSSRAISIALTLPALVSLDLNGLSAADVPACPTSRVRRLALRYCPAETCAAVLGAVPELSEVHLEYPTTPPDRSGIWETLAEHELASLYLEYMPCSTAALGRALGGSEATLASLRLHAVDGVDRDEFLAGRSWPSLHTLRWSSGSIAHLGTHLPATLTALSLRDTTVASLQLDEAWFSNLISLDCVESTACEAVAARLETAPGRLVHLGLGANDAAARTVASLSSAPESSLRSLELGRAFRSYGFGERPWAESVPTRLESLTIGSWSFPEELLLDLLRGDRLEDLRDLIFQDVHLGNPELGGRFSPRLRRLELRDCLGFIEGLGHANQPLALSRLVLEDVEVRQHELVSLLSYCTLVSLCLNNVVGFGHEGLTAVLALTGASLVQLELGRFSDDAVPYYGHALLASEYPSLSELRLNRSMFSPRAFTHLMDVEATPALEYLDVDDPIPDEQWLELIARAPSPLHWIRATTSASIDALLALLRDASSGVAGACFDITPSME